MNGGKGVAAKFGFGELCLSLLVVLLISLGVKLSVRNYAHVDFVTFRKSVLAQVKNIWRT